MTVGDMEKALLGQLLQEAGLVPNPPERLDLRPEEEIRAQINSYTPVTSERNVWAYWDKGFDSMPSWRQRNIIDWVRRNSKRGWTVRVLNIVPGSANHIHQYIYPTYLPIAINEGRMKGRESQQGISDFLRLATLYQHGGVYLDVGIVLIRDLDDICWSLLEDASSPYNVAGPVVEGIAFVSFFLAARKNDVFMHRWLQVLLKVWGDRESAAGTCHHPLLSHMGLIISPAFPPDTNWEELTDYVAVTQCAKRVMTNREPGENGLDGPSYFRKHVYTLAERPELSGLELSGLEFRKALMTTYKLSENASQSEKKEQSDAFRHVMKALAGMSAYKFYSGLSLFGMPQAAAKYWDQPEHADEESQPGTWGAVFRYGTLHYRQTRVVEPLFLPEGGDYTEAGALSAVSDERHYTEEKAHDFVVIKD